MRPASSATPALLAGAVFLLAFLGLALQAACRPPPLPVRAVHLSHASLLSCTGCRVCCAGRRCSVCVVYLINAPRVRRRRRRDGEEKVRLGSSPPSCRGKCYECSPCTAVQVPTLSSTTSRPRPRPRGDQVATLSNYKPVGWKCQCRDRLYEP
ncbi:hypothetical protein U9M48_038484 [Paspalum notatum var. saurae]|uniref:Epidermal patterning factor-like protein n=1 Tax=Paspalum notatum var. saurae TaxID=547442 RepID=A0AAQ3UHN6_PASNO